jgi:hypothetical protein
MHFQFDHEIDASLARVEAALLGPELLRRLPEFSPAIAMACVLTCHDHGDRVEREALYSAAFVPEPLAAVIPRAWTTWIERTQWDRRTHAGSFCIEPQIPALLRRRVTCHGDYVLCALAAQRTSRRISGALEIAAPGVGRRAEVLLARLIAQQFAGEATLLGALAREPA